MSFSGGANELLATAVEQSAQLGVILVGAAGDRLNGKVETFPAAYEAVVAVTAVDSRLRPYRAAARGAYLAFAAPGVDVPLARAGGGTVVQTGTSFAAPFVSAAFALLRGSDRDGDSETARALLRDAARDLGPPGRDPIFGWGLVRVPTTLRCGTYTSERSAGGEVREADGSGGLRRRVKRDDVKPRRPLSHRTPGQKDPPGGPPYPRPKWSRAAESSPPGRIRGAAPLPPGDTRAPVIQGSVGKTLDLARHPRFGGRSTGSLQADRRPSSGPNPRDRASLSPCSTIRRRQESSLPPPPR